MTDAANGRSYSEIIADFAAGLTLEQLPREVVVKAKVHIMDSVGVGLGGTTTEWWQRAYHVCQRLGGPPEATVFGQSMKLGVASAAMANSIAVTALDYDDTDYWGAGTHMSRYVVGTALSVGETARCSGKDVITAAVAGYEVASRVGAALLVDRYGPRAATPDWGQKELDAHHRLQRRGIPMMAVLPGLFACSVIAGRLFGLDAQQMTSAQGFAGGFGLFLAQSHREGADGVPLHVGWACHAGIAAAMFAKEGLRGPRFIYEGDRGFLSVIANELHDATRLTAGLGQQWNTLNNILKYYPAGHGTHHFIESLKGLMAERSFSADDILDMECRAPAQRVEFHFEPKEAKLHPTPFNARFSLPYLLARLAMDGELGPQSFAPDRVFDPKALELASRVNYVTDEQAWIGDKRGLTIVRLKDGRTLSRSTPDVLGMPNRPGSRQDMLSKFRANAMSALGDEERVEALIEALEALEGAEDVGAVMRLTASG
ncbi:MAG: MmgE/PrpD family protein [Chloroflexi bacterium]|nr:MmgE/PrpD family protein [Chloroflexota bacterium]